MFFIANIGCHASYRKNQCNRNYNQKPIYTNISLTKLESRKIIPNAYLKYLALKFSLCDLQFPNRSSNTPEANRIKAGKSNIPLNIENTS